VPYRSPRATGRSPESPGSLRYASGCVDAFIAFKSGAPWKFPNDANNESLDAKLNGAPLCGVVNNALFAVVPFTPAFACMVLGEVTSLSIARSPPPAPDPPVETYCARGAALSLFGAGGRLWLGAGCALG